MELKIGVIGAGPAGLATARAMKDAGFETIVFERNRDVGGIWDIEAPGTPMYRSAHFISSKGHDMSHFAGHPFSTDIPEYPSHAQVHDYLRSFADLEDLYPLIRFESEIERCRPLENGGWRIDGQGFSEDCDAIIVCSGTLWDAVTPEFEGSFSGMIRHSQTYRDPEEFRDKKILILGCGNSGVDIACDAARTADKAYLSLRRGYWFLPKFVMGHPTDVFFARNMKMPDWLSPPDFTAFLAMMVGNPKRFGLPAPDHEPLASHPIMNNDILQHLGHGRIQPRGDVACLEGESVCFKSGELDEVDEIICATGYRATMSFLPDNLLNYQEGTRPSLKMSAFHPSAQNIYFNGMIETNGGVFGLFDRLAKIIARLIAQKAAKSCRDSAFTEMVNEADLKAHTTGKINSSRHVGYVDNANYLSALKHLEEQLNI
ncbi:NAD(P)/FAD-dependent oxidoreductase [Sphingorhabdus sp. EL138]|uniref:flavin-containing monooxygenase n=1 Tax=Sphingorhabdus sp. EL138 TaxID=2073156 RepID=UPI000D687C87|nr:NAD(P)-binding domain-containing protein [Sphingorhabdus sp. EL138]